MLNLELIREGLDDTLRDIMNDLEPVVGKHVSKSEKDAAICKTLGAINAIWYLLRVTENGGNKHG